MYICIDIIDIDIQVRDGLSYEASFDCSGSEESMEAYILAMELLNQSN